MEPKGDDLGRVMYMKKLITTSFDRHSDSMEHSGKFHLHSTSATDKPQVVRHIGIRSRDDRSH